MSGSCEMSGKRLSCWCLAAGLLLVFSHLLWEADSLGCFLPVYLPDLTLRAENLRVSFLPADLWLGLLLPSGAEAEELGLVIWSQRE